jgi:spermidine/putrescine transport system ATP-binding protein
MTAAVRLSDVSKSYGSHPAVSDLSLEVEEGEFLTLLGPSGCGKTTTLRLVSGFEVPDRGLVQIGEEIVNSVPPYRRNVNTVFQSYALFPHMTVFENVAYGPTLKRLPARAIRERVTEMLTRVELLPKAQNMPRQLSGGEMQRIALARALINEPKVLLLDEPLGALDAKLRKSMQLELKHVHKRLGITFIYVTHDQEEALVMSDRIAVMHAGRIMQLGPPSDIFERPNSRFVADFIGIGNFLTVTTGEATEGTRRIRFDTGETWNTEIPTSIPEGRGLTVAVRPQRVGFSDGGLRSGPRDNLVPAVLRDVVYVGSWIRLIVEIDGGHRITIEKTPEAMPVDYRSLEEGQKLTLRVPPDALLHFAE